jgi:polyhydroxybutyrate depolymerase
MLRASLVIVLAACGTPASVDENLADADPGDPSSDAPLATACRGKTAQPLDAAWMIGSRSANVHVPASYDPTARTPVVINIHGRTQGASAQATLSHAVARSDASGFILVHPQSATSPTSWNAGTCCDPASTNDVDDVGYVAALLDKLETELCVDPDRVFAMGMSNGGYLSHTLGCRMADRIAAIGPVAGLLLESTCEPARPVPTMMVNGTADTLSQYQYVASGVDFWTANNGCTTTMQTYQHGDATCVTHGGCDAGADVVLCTIADGGHQWPGGDTLPFLGTKSDNLIATDAIWEFFVAHPRP